MTTYISSGVTSTLHVTDDNSFEVESGGVSTNSTVGNYCTEYVDAGGKSIDDTVTYIGQIDDYGSALGAQVDGGGVLYGDAGVVSGAVISSGGTIYVYDGTRDEKLTVLGGGYAYLGNGESTTNAVISAGGFVALDLQISSGETYLFPNLDDSRTETVGGITLEAGANLGYYNVTVDPEGILSLTASAVLSNNLVNVLYGSEYGASVSVASGARIIGQGMIDGTLSEQSGAFVSGIDVIGSISLASGATTDNLSLTLGYSPQYSAVIPSGAVVSGLDDSGQGYNPYDLTVEGLASHVEISSDAGIDVVSGGLLDLVALLDGGNLYLNGGGSADSVVISSGGYLYLGSGGSAVGVAVSTGGSVYVDSAVVVQHVTDFGSVTDEGETIGDRVSKGGVENVSNFGVASATIVFEGGTLLVGAGGLTVSGVVSSGGGIALSSGGRASATVVSRGGIMDNFGVVIASGQISSTSVVETQTTSSGLTLMSGARIGFDAPTVEDGGELILGAGGFALNATVGHGMLLGRGDLAGLSSDNGGLVSGARITDGTLLDEGLVESVQVGGDLGAGELIVEAVASGVHLEAGSIFVGSADSREVLSAVLSGAYLSGGELTVGVGGVASAVIVASGAELELSGGLLSGISIHAGGQLVGSGFVPGGMEGHIADAGLVSDVQLVSGGGLTVEAGASAALVGANSGTLILILSGGHANDLTTVRGAELIDDGVAVYSGAGAYTLAGDLVGGGSLAETAGVLRLDDDASTFHGAVTIYGGAIELATSHGLGAAPITFAPLGSATARLELLTEAQPPSGQTFAEALVNFGKASDQLDLARQSFVSGATATLSGHLLTLVDGDYTASFVLSGTTAASYQVVSDGVSGTLITAGASPAALAQHMAVIGGGTGAGAASMAAGAVGGPTRSAALSFGHVSGQAA